MDTKEKNIFQSKIFRLYVYVILVILIFVCGLFYWQKYSDTKSNNTINSANENYSGTVLAFYNNSLGVTAIDSIENESAQSLPDKLIIKPGTYNVYGKVYNLDKEGLYRFLAPSVGNEQRIVYKSDIDSLMSGLAWVSSHGTLDNTLKLKDLEKKSLTGKIVVTCNKISDFAKYLLDREKIESRVMAGSTTGDLNGFDDTHAMVEVKINGVWKVFDLDNNVVFKSDGKYLNYVEMQNLVSSNNYQIEKISADTALAINNFSDLNSGYDYSFYGEETMYSEQALREWYKKVLQMFFVKSGSNYYYYEINNDSVNNLAKNYIKITKDEFYKKFYN